jgi:hypothetical protein
MAIYVEFTHSERAFTYKLDRFGRLIEAYPPPPRVRRSKGWRRHTRREKAKG